LPRSAPFQQLALVEAAVRVDLVLVGGEFRQGLVRQEFQLGDADAVLAGDDAVQGFRQAHDARHRLVGGLQHGVVVGVDRDVGVHVAVAGVHVQGDEHPALEHALVEGVALGQHRLVFPAGEDLAQFRPDLPLP
jgi:hypothetical protein